MMIRILLLLCLAFPAHGQFPVSGAVLAADQVPTTPAAPPAILVLNATTNISPGAYSLSRRMSTNWTGNILTVVRSSDSATNDITYASGSEAIDIAALEAFVGPGNDGYLERVYDQTGNGRHLAVTATTQWALIVTNGVAVLGSNGRLAATFDGTDDRVLSPSTTLGLPITYLVVEKSISHTSGDFVVSGNGTTAVAMRHSATANAMRINAGATTLNTAALSLGQWYLIRSLVVSGTSDQIQVNDGTATTGDAGDGTIGNNFEIGDTTLVPNMQVSEWIIFSSLPSAGDLTTLQNNINTWYALW